MTYVADLHLHSSYAMGTSPNLDLPEMLRWARLKGIDLITAADFTHPQWLDRLERSLVPLGGDLFGADGESETKVVLGTEISCVYRENGRGRRVHLLLFAPSFETVHRLCAGFAKYGALESDGRPLLKLPARDAMALALEVDDRCEVVPAHVWTPWYSVFGSKSGFNSLEECFGDLADRIHAVETGLSSDPSMNWRVDELRGRSLVSFSDAHSAPRMGRELTVFKGEVSYEGFRAALKDQAIDRTVEFYPEEGKYHFDGHRKCGVSQHPAVTMEVGERCPVCGKRLTLGVLNRLEALATLAPDVTRRPGGLYVDPSRRRPPFRRLVPLDELVAACLGLGVGAKAVRRVYDHLVEGLGSELRVLEEAGFDAIADLAEESIAAAVIDGRLGNVTVVPGYDGQFGSVAVGSSRA